MKTVARGVVEKGVIALEGFLALMLGEQTFDQLAQPFVGQRLALPAKVVLHRQTELEVAQRAEDCVMQEDGPAAGSAVVADPGSEDAESIDVRVSLTIAITAETRRGTA